MSVIAFIVGLFLLCIVHWEAFETIVLPRTVTRRLRITSLLYKYGWRSWYAIARRLPQGSARESFLSYFGPISLPVLLGFWAICLIFSFALIQWALRPGIVSSGGDLSFQTHLYMSGVTLFTLGYGDVVPRTHGARFFAVLEAGVGFGFLAIVIGYLPVLYQAFSRREVDISLLDARAGSPATAVELLRRHGISGNLDALAPLFKDWEHWSADLLESHLSFPVLAYYRSQHDRESWLAALTTILDTCALSQVGCSDKAAWQAGLTFAMARHAIIDLALVFDIAPVAPPTDRLPPGGLERIRNILAKANVLVAAGLDNEKKLADLRALYEPYVYSLGIRFALELPPWITEVETADNWQTSAWSHTAESRSHFGQ